MRFSYSFEEIGAAEERAIAGGTPSGNLMERAGSALADAVQRAMKERGVSDVLFVCGGGNNGGDGFVAARVLHERGADVAVLCLAGKFSHECAEAAKRYKGVLFGRIPRRRFALIVDCIFGTGISRAPEGDAATLISFMNDSGAYVLSCDLPSGLSEGGIAFRPCVKANGTLTVGGMKNALLLADGADIAGEVSLLDIGITPENGAEVWEDADVKTFFPKKKSHSDKGDYGNAVILGGYGALGAPMLAAGACLKSGAGYTELWMPSAGSRETDEMHRSVAAAKYPACLFSVYSGEPFSAKAVAFGMGANVGDPTRVILEELLLTYQYGTLVLDADALNTLAVCKTVDMLRRKKSPVIVTPHIKEFSRLTGKPIGEILADPIECAKNFAREYGVIVVLKNNRTVITDGVRTAINVTGSPALARGGSGDALAGLLAGTCARGVPPFEAACVSSYLLGRAGELAAAELGEYSPDASDIIGFLPKSILSL